MVRTLLQTPTGNPSKLVSALMIILLIVLCLRWHEVDSWPRSLGQAQKEFRNHLTEAPQMDDEPVREDQPSRRPHGTREALRTARSASWIESQGTRRPAHVRGLEHEQPRYPAQARRARHRLHPVEARAGAVVPRPFAATPQLAQDHDFPRISLGIIDAREAATSQRSAFSVAPGDDITPWSNVEHIPSRPCRRPRPSTSTARTSPAWPG